MKLLFTKEGLRKKILSAPDGEPTAGNVGIDESLANENAGQLGERNVVQLRIALGVLVRQLRVRDGLSIAILASKADVSEEELRQVEHNPNYTARPRLIYQLSQFFNVPLTKLSQMSGSTIAVNRQLYNEAVKFAAFSDDLSTLTEDERASLDQFVTVLNQRAKA